jgi:hypothetical protein
MRMDLKRDARVLRALPRRTFCVLGLICVMYADKVEQKIHLYENFDIYNAQAKDHRLIGILT